MRTGARRLSARTKPLDRARFIGGSDVAAVLGLSPWTTPVELWQAKTGQAAPRKTDPARDRRLARGKALEPVVLEMVVDKLREGGLQVEVLRKNARYIDPVYTYMSVEIDFELRLTGAWQVAGRWVQFDGEEVTGDCKTVHGFARKKWGEEDTEDVPIEYAAQFAQGLGVTGLRYCLVAALIGLDDVAIYWVVRDDETIAAMRAKVVEFWQDCVVARKAPDPFRFSDIKALYPTDNGRTLEATEEIADKVRELAKLAAQTEMLEARAKLLRLDVAEYLGEFRNLSVGGKPAAALTSYTQTRLDEALLRRQHPTLVPLYERETPVRALRLNARFR